MTAEEHDQLKEEHLAEQDDGLEELSFFADIISDDKSDHLLTTSSSTVFKCLQCGYSYTSQELLEDHILNEHSPENSRIKCSSCPVTFATKKIFNFHMEHCHPDTCFTCQICNQTFHR